VGCTHTWEWHMLHMRSPSPWLSLVHSESCRNVGRVMSPRRMRHATHVRKGYMYPWQPFASTAGASFVMWHVCIYTWYSSTQDIHVDWRCTYACISCSSNHRCQGNVKKRKPASLRYPLPDLKKNWPRKNVSSVCDPCCSYDMYCVVYFITCGVMYHITFIV